MAYLKEDFKRYLRGKRGFFNIVKISFLTQGLWAIIVYRAGSWCFNNKKNKIWVRLILPFLSLSSKLVEVTTGISIPFSARIGKGFYIGHFGAIILSPQTIILTFR